MSEEEVVESTEEVVEEVAEETPVEESSFVDNMLSQINNDDIKSAGFWKNLEGKDANEVGMYIKELQSFAGKKGDIPKSDATDEEWAEFYQKLGRPADIEGYDFTIGDEFTELVGKESIPYFEKTVDKIKEQAFQMGASSDQAEEMVNIFLESVAESVEESNQDNTEILEEMEKELRTEWGEEYDGMLNGIEAMLTANGFPEENMEYLKQSGMLKDPAFAITMGNIASKFADDPEIGHHQTNTMAGLRDQLAEVNMDIAEMVRTGTKIPPHIAQKRLDLMNKLGDNL
jgi:vacuolar-type H+-ATPase subunit H